MINQWPAITFPCLVLNLYWVKLTRKLCVVKSLKKKKKKKGKIYKWPVCLRSRFGAFYLRKSNNKHPIPILFQVLLHILESRLMRNFVGDWKKALEWGPLIIPHQKCKTLKVSSDSLSLLTDSPCLEDVPLPAPPSWPSLCPTSFL